MTDKKDASARNPLSERVFLHVRGQNFRKVSDRCILGIFPFG
jgi:hypothetical protein